jgi:excisionase family DNA binding protein
MAVTGELEHLMTVEEVAEYLRMSTRYVYRNSRRMGAFKFGRELRFRRDDVQRWLRAQRA